MRRHVWRAFAGVLAGCALWMLAANAIAQEATEQAADSADPTSAQAQAPAAEDDSADENGKDSGAAADEDKSAKKKDAKDPEAVLREEARASAQAEKGDEDGDSAGAEQAGDKDASKQDKDGDFVPSEKIWADSALAFPSDI